MEPQEYKRIEETAAAREIDLERSYSVWSLDGAPTCCGTRQASSDAFKYARQHKLIKRMVIVAPGKKFTELQESDRIS